MFWLGLAAVAAIAPLVRWWLLSLSRARSTSGLRRVLVVGGHGPTATVARAVALAMNSSDRPVGAATMGEHLSWYEPSGHRGRCDPRRPTTLAELVALAAQLAGPAIEEIVVDAGPLDFSSSASVRGRRPVTEVVVLLGLGDRTSDRAVIIDALCPYRGVVITTETTVDRLDELSDVAVRRGSLVVVVDTAGLADAALARAVAAAAAEVVDGQIIVIPPVAQPSSAEPAFEPRVSSLRPMPRPRAQPEVGHA